MVVLNSQKGQGHRDGTLLFTTEVNPWYSNWNSMGASHIVMATNLICDVIILNNKKYVIVHS